jgi:hypothetical protein
MPAWRLLSVNLRSKMLPMLWSFLPGPLKVIRSDKWRNAHHSIRQRLTNVVDGERLSNDKLGFQMEKVFGAELRLTAEEFQSLLIGSLAVVVAIVVFAVAMAL